MLDRIFRKISKVIPGGISEGTPKNHNEIYWEILEKIFEENTGERGVLKNHRKSFWKKLDWLPKPIFVVIKKKLWINFWRNP